MAKQDWSPEPWKVDASFGGCGIYRMFDANGDRVDFSAKDNLDRIAACVNALASGVVEHEKGGPMKIDLNLYDKD